MRTVASGIAAVLLCSSLAASPIKNTVKEPWLWTAEERLRARFDYGSKAERANQAQASTRTLPPRAWPINGETHPELFFPWELMDRLLRTQLLPGAEATAVRESFRVYIEASGWNVDEFWTVLAATSGAYLLAFERIRQEHSERRSAVGGSSEPLRNQLCAARAAALVVMRSTFGNDAFDRFLYTAVARDLRTWISDDRDAGTLMRVERGCR